MHDAHATDPSSGFSDASAQLVHLFALLQSTGAAKISKTREFKLASGQMSDHYFDLRLLCGDPDGIGAVASAMYDAILQRQQKDDAATKHPQNTPQAVGGLESGSISIAAAISHLSGQMHRQNPDTNPQLTSFFVRKNRKEYGTQKMIEGVIRGSPVLVVDDVITSGGSALRAVEVVRDAGYECDRLLCVIYRGSDEQAKAINDVVRLEYLFRADDIIERLGRK